MSAPVDVLAVMDAEIAALPQMASMASVHGVNCDPEEAVRRMTEARAAVAELIEKAHAAQSDLQAMLAAAERGEVWVVSAANRLRNGNLTAALARMKGVQS